MCTPCPCQYWRINRYSSQPQLSASIQNSAVRHWQASTSITAWKLNGDGDNESISAAPSAAEHCCHVLWAQTQQLRLWRWLQMSQSLQKTKSDLQKGIALAQHSSGAKLVLNQQQQDQKHSQVWISTAERRVACFDLVLFIKTIKTLFSRFFFSLFPVSFYTLNMIFRQVIYY